MTVIVKLAFERKKLQILLILAALGQGLHDRSQALTNPELKRLADALPFVLRSSLAESTNKKYERGWMGWKSWASTKDGVTVCPGDPFFVCLYLTALTFSNGTKGALSDAFYGIRWGHHLAGYISPTDNATVQMAFEGAQRICAKPVRKKDPMVAEMVRAIIDSFGTGDPTLHDFRFLIVVTICYAGFLRIEELLATKLGCIKLKQTHLEIFLEECKNDQHREGNKVIIARTGTRYCPVGIVEKFLKRAGLDLKTDSSAHLIPRLISTKRGLKAHRTLGIGYTRAREVFKDYVSPLEREGYNLGLHSMRAGGATMASENNVEGDLIDIHGRWKSGKSKAIYIRHSLNKRLSVSQSLGL